MIIHHLKRISIIHCGLLEVVFGKAEEKIDSIALFAQLQSLALSHRPYGSEPQYFGNCHEWLSKP